MDVLVPFFTPQAEERLHILQLHLPEDHCMSPAFLETAARRCALNGGQLRNAVLHAALLAIDEEEAPTDRHLEDGLRSEYRKAGAPFPLDAFADKVIRDGGMEAFVGALASR